MNLSGIISKVKAIWTAVALIVPTLPAMIETVEAAFPAGSAGQTKLEAVKNMLAAGWSKIQGVEATFEEIWPAIEGIVAALVAMYNNAGLFKKSSPPQSQ